MKRLCLFLLLTVSISLAQAATHSVTLTWIDASNPAGTTYNVYRATGLCSGTPTFSRIASALTVKTFTDSTVSPGNYCFQVTAVFSGSESAPSNSVNPNVPAFSPTSLTFTVQ
jgi:hypothetical protein